MLDLYSLFIAFSIGILGGAHCIGMCGGIIGALTLSIDESQPQKRILIVMCYNVGRVLSYLVIAFIFYQLIGFLEAYFALQFMRYIAGILLIAMGLYLANWWRGLIYLEKGGAYLWRYIQPLSRSLLPVNSYKQAFFLGMIWGWLPCGLIYSALAYATAAESSVAAVLTMLAFALGTLPAVLATGLLAQQLTVLVNHSILRKVFAVTIILFGIWTLLTSSGHSH